MLTRTYTGEGSMEKPKFPLKYVKPSGAIVICHSVEEVVEVMKADDRAALIGLGIAAAVWLAAIVAVLVVL